jgi:hypothetical protein
MRPWKFQNDDEEEELEDELDEEEIEDDDDFEDDEEEEDDEIAVHPSTGSAPASVSLSPAIPPIATSISRFAWRGDASVIRR